MVAVNVKSRAWNILILTSPEVFMSKLSDLMSRWMIERECRCCSPLHVWPLISTCVI